MECATRGECPLKNLLQNFRVWIVAALVRVVAWILVSDFCKTRPELVVPQNSFERLADGIYMRASGISPYDGDMLHSQPVLLDVFSPIADRPRLLLFFFILFDLAIAELLGAVASKYLQENFKGNDDSLKTIPNFIVKCYLLNPVTIGACIVFSLSVVYNLVTALFLLYFAKGCLMRSCALYALLVSFTFYPAVFIFALLVRFPRAAQRASVILLSAASLLAFTGLNRLSEGGFEFLDSTYVFLLDVRDLSPNVGVFWYFFIEVFNHFRLFFMWVFQVNILVYLIPLTLTLRSNPYLLLHLLLILVSVFSSYPSMAECLIYLSLVPMFVDLHKYIRWGLVIGGTLATCVVLAPITWDMWIVTGSGNANFYFAVTLCYSVAQIFLLTDLLYAHLRVKVVMDRGVAVEDDLALFVLK